jgi:hypothetical protein
MRISVLTDDSGKILAALVPESSACRPLKNAPVQSFGLSISSRCRPSTRVVRASRQKVSRQGITETSRPAKRQGRDPKRQSRQAGAIPTSHPIFNLAETASFVPPPRAGCALS